MNNSIKKQIIGAVELLWSFKWYISVYLLFFLIMFAEYLNPPTADDKIFHADETSQNWLYTNQEVYIGSLRQGLIAIILLFLVGTSNMRNHPILSKIIFLLPLFGLVIGLIIGIFQ